MSNVRRNEKQISDDDRILAHSAPQLIPVLERKRETILARVRASYYANEELRSVVGEYVSMCELIRELEVKLQNLQGEK